MRIRCKLMNHSPQSLASYLPRRLLNRLVEGPAIAQPEVTLRDAVLLLSDIQGFTALVEAFTRSGPGGLEELTWVLNRYFIDLSEEVIAHGGDVLCIAGDAFLCHWPVLPGATLHDTVLLAAAAAQSVQARLHEREAGHGRRFHTRIGLSAGPLCLGLVGGVGGRWELVASGPALHDAAAAEAACTPGAVALSAPAWGLISAAHAGRELPGGQVELLTPLAKVPAAQHAALPLSSHDATLLHPYVPPAVLARGAATAEWLAEVRNVTVLLADLPALNDDQPEAVQRTQRSVAAFQQVVQRFEGTVRVDVDDKGIMVLAVFGLPPRAHEDDARRAVRAAHTLHDALIELGVQCGIGIASGRAFCGAFGSDLRREYLVRGDVINLAARLMRMANVNQGAQVVIDHATMQALRGSYELRELSAVVVKGRSEPVRSYLPLAERQAAHTAHRAPVGREAERQLLRDAAQRLQQAHQGSLTLIHADAGLGKSTLVAEARQQAQAQGLRVLQGAAGAVESTTAYFAWQPVFRALLGVDGGAARDDVAQRVNQYMQALPEWARLAPLLGSVLGLALPEDPLTAQLTGAVRAENTRRLLTAILAHEAARTPTLLVLEDAHWLDSSSWAVLHDAATLAGTLMLVVTTRPLSGADSAEFARLEQLPGCQVLRLDTLASEHMGQLIAQRLGLHAVPPALLNLVQERAAGHPFFCEELLQSLLESGSLRVTEGRCEVGDLKTLVLPNSVQGVILSRIDRLTPGQHLCLKVAAVIGLSFTLRTVSDTLPQRDEQSQAHDNLRGLHSVNLTLPAEVTPEAWRFRHAITRDVAYELMPQAQRQPIHHAVAQWLEQHHAQELAAQSALLAHHWGHAAAPERALHYLELAGEQALRNGAFGEALQFFEQAVALHAQGAAPADAPRRARWQKGLATATYFLGDLQRSRQHAESVAGMLDWPVPAGGLALARGLARALTRQIAHRIWPQRFLGRRAGEHEVLDEAADAYRMLSQIYYLAGANPNALVYVTLRGVNVGEQAGPSPTLARNLSNMGTLCGFMGKPAWAQWYGRRAIDMAEHGGQAAAAAYVWSNKALSEAQAGHWAGALAANTEALQRVQQLGDFNFECEVLSIRAALYTCSGDFTAAPSAYERQRALALRKGNQQMLCWALLDEVETCLMSERDDEAAAVLERALAVPTAATDGSSTLDKLQATAQVRLRQGRSYDAAAAARPVLDAITHHAPAGYYWVAFGANATEVFIDLLDGAGAARADRLAQAQRGCKALAKLARTFGNVRPRAALLAGRLHAAQGNAAAALASLQQALQLAQAMDMRFEQARAQLEIARLGAGDRPALSQAAQAFEALGAVRLLTQARALLTRA